MQMLILKLPMKETNEVSKNHLHSLTSYSCFRRPLLSFSHKDSFDVTSKFCLHFTVTCALRIAQTLQITGLVSCFLCNSLFSLNLFHLKYSGNNSAKSGKAFQHNVRNK